MADDSSIVFRWDINNVSATRGLNNVESAEFNEGGFKWTAAAERQFNGTIGFILRCGVDHNRLWKCEADVDVGVVKRNGSVLSWTKGRFIFNDQFCRWVKGCGKEWSSLANWGIDNNTLTFEFRINIISSDKGVPIVDPATFFVPNRMSNVILKIGDQKFHVLKELLALHSPVFETMFFGEFAEKGKKEVALKDVICEEFIDLLNLIYLKSSKIMDHTVLHILKLADQFQMQDILNLVEEYLSNSKGIDVAKKLILADQYRLHSFRDRCFQSFNSVYDLTVKLNNSSEYANFSEGLKAALFERIMQLSHK